MMNKYCSFVLLLFVVSCTSERDLPVAGPESIPHARDRAPVEASEASGVLRADTPVPIPPVELPDADQAPNTPPQLTEVKFVPEVFTAGDSLGVDVSAVDADGDAVTILYEWTLNDAMPGGRSRLEAPQWRGDKIKVKITPYDNKNYGRSIVLSSEVGNMPPIIIPGEKSTLSGNAFPYQVHATDPDDDPLTYRLENGPVGMEIASTSGLVKWTVPDVFSGTARPSILVEDGAGGKARYDLKISIQTENQKEPVL
jgi:hypothetical protein